MTDASAIVDTDSLPSTQYLILEVLAARHRIGEMMWTFPSTLRPQMKALAALRLINWKSGVTAGTIRAWLTNAGRAAALLDGYEPPRTRHAAAVLSWDWRGQPDLDHLGRILRDMSGGALHLRSADTGSDECAAVVSTVPLDEPTTNGIYRQWLLAEGKLADIFPVEEIAP